MCIRDRPYRPPWLPYTPHWLRKPTWPGRNEKEHGPLLTNYTSFIIIKNYPSICKYCCLFLLAYCLFQFLCLQSCNLIYPKNSWIEEEACEVKSIQFLARFDPSIAHWWNRYSLHILYLFPQIGWDLYIRICLSCGNPFPLSVCHPSLPDATRI